MELITETQQVEVVKIETIEIKTARIPFKEMKTSGKINISNDIILEYSTPSINGYKLRILFDKGVPKANFGCVKISYEDISRILTQLDNPKNNIITKIGFRRENDKIIKGNLVEKSENYYIVETTINNYKALPIKDYQTEEYEENLNLLKDCQGWYGQGYIDMYGFKNRTIQCPKPRAEEIVRYIHKVFESLIKLNKEYGQ